MPATLPIEIENALARTAETLRAARLDYNRLRAIAEEALDQYTRAEEGLNQLCRDAERARAAWTVYQEADDAHTRAMLAAGAWQNL